MVKVNIDIDDAKAESGGRDDPGPKVLVSDNNDAQPAEAIIERSSTEGS